MQVSVVIPTYNRPSFLRGAIDTALGQTYQDIEVIVVDDGSHESYVAEIVEAYPESVEAVTHPENKGLSAARNTGIDVANGSYIAFLDDDDRWHREKIERQVRALKSSPRAALATCLVTAVTPAGDIVHLERHAPSGDCYMDMLVGNVVGTPSRVVVRRSALEDVGGFDESLRTKQDWDLYLRLSERYEFVAVEAPLCFRTVHRSMSSSPASAKRDNRAILRKHETAIRANGRWADARAQVEELIGRSHLEAGSLAQARSHLRTSFRCAPTLRRGALIALAHSPPLLIDGAIALKRSVMNWRAGASQVDLSPDHVPGIDT